jgi:hypothetical protein
MEDHTFRPKGKNGLSGSEIGSLFVEGQRRKGKQPGTIANLSNKTKVREQEVLAYKVFGVYSRSYSSVKPTLNKHEIPKGKL